MADAERHQPEPHHDRTGLGCSVQDVGQGGHKLVAAPALMAGKRFRVIVPVALPVWVVLIEPPPA